MTEIKEKTIEERKALALIRRPWLAEIPQKLCLKLLMDFALMMLNDDKELLEDMACYGMKTKDKQNQ